MATNKQAVRGRSSYAYSTLSSSVEYTTYEQGGADIKIAGHKVVIAGGAGMATKHLQTPRGVATQISEFDLQHLKENELFKLHVKNGHIKIEERKADVDEVVADMTGRDPSSPIVPQDFAEDKAPKTGAPA